MSKKGDIVKCLKQTFRNWDTGGNGTISRESLESILGDLDPDLQKSEVRLLFDLAGLDEQGKIRYDDFIDFLSESSSTHLSEGSFPDSGFEALHRYVDSLLAACQGDGNSERTRCCIDCLNGLIEIFDTQKQVSACRGYQTVAVDKGVIGPLFGLVCKVACDEQCNKSLQVLARLAFHNDDVAGVIARHPDFHASVSSIMQSNTFPEKQAVLKLIQSVAASQTKTVSEAVPNLVSCLAPHLSDEPIVQIKSLTGALIEALVSCSFHCPSSVAVAMSWPTVAALGAEDSARPTWLPLDPFWILICGQLVANLLGATQEEVGEEKELRQLMTDRLSTGHFFEYLTMAVEASADNQEWPVGSGKFHSPIHLALTVRTLAKNGYRNTLVKLIPPLSLCIHDSSTDSSGVIVLESLRNLCDDAECLQCLIDLVHFRKGTLERLSNDSCKEAIELKSFIEMCEELLCGAKESFTSLSQSCKHAPSVTKITSIFVHFGALDRTITLPQLLEALRRVPVGPSASLKQQLAAKGKIKKIGFKDFYRFVYGTPTETGLWQLLMEGAAASLQSLEGPDQASSLANALALFERGANSKATCSTEILLKDIIPTSGLQAQGDSVQDDMNKLGAKDTISFPEFAAWFASFCMKVKKV